MMPRTAADRASARAYAWFRENRDKSPRVYVHPFLGAWFARLNTGRVVVTQDHASALRAAADLLRNHEGVPSCA